MSMNVFSATGRLTQDVDLRYTTSGTATGTFTLAVNRNFKTKEGGYEADFIRCVIWRKSAENLANLTHKGSQIGITGRVQTRNYENQQGQRVYVTEVIVDEFYLLDSRSEPANSSQAQGPNNQGNYATNVQNQSQAPFMGGQEVDITDDDLPF